MGDPVLESTGGGVATATGIRVRRGGVATGIWVSSGVIAGDLVGGGTVPAKGISVLLAKILMPFGIFVSLPVLGDLLGDGIVGMWVLLGDLLGEGIESVLGILVLLAVFSLSGRSFLDGASFLSGVGSFADAPLALDPVPFSLPMPILVLVE